MIRIGIIFTAAFGVTLTLSGCVGANGSQTGPVPSASSDASISIVAARTITSVIVVSGDVQAQPHFLVFAPVAGVVHFDEDSGSLAAGTQIGQVGQQVVRLPVAGAVSSQLVSDGQTAVANTPIADIVATSFGVVVNVPPAQLYRVYSQPTTAKTSIDSGPAGIDCQLEPVSGADAQGKTDEAASGYRPVVCLLPLDAKVVSGLPAKVGVETARKDAPMALPVSAVAGSTQSGQVTLIQGSRHVLRSVKLGISDGAYIEIVSGLKAGDKVLSYAPSLN